MAIEEIHVGDIGTKFQATIRDEDDAIVDVSEATNLELRFRKPRASTYVSKEATLSTDGTDGKIEYTTVEGDLDLPGTWIVQGYVVLEDGTWHSNKHVFPVHSNV